MKSPTCSACSCGLPQNVGSLPLGLTSFEIGTETSTLFCSGPPRPNRKLPVQYAIQLSMIVVITSCAPTVAFRKPAMRRDAGAGEHRERDREEDVQALRHPGPRRADPDRDDRAGDVLALAADVEEAAAERERDGEPRADQRRRQDQRLRQVVRREAVRVGVPPEEDLVVRERDVDVVVAELEEPVQAGAVPDRLVRAQRVVARGEHDEPAGEEGEQHREERRDDAAGALVEREPLRDARHDAARLGDLRLLGRDGHAAPPPALPPVIAIPSSSSVTPGSNSPDDPALVDDEDAVGEREHLLELERDEQHGASLVALLDEPAVHELDRADVEPARRLRRDQDTRVARHLARDHDLLLVAARERGRARALVAAADVELGEELLAVGEELAEVQEAARRERRLRVVVQHEVLGERELEHEPAPVPVLGDVADAVLEERVRAAVRQVAPADDDAPFARAAQAR